MIFLTAILINIPSSSYSQNDLSTDTVKSFTLGDCVKYALRYQPALKQSIINQSIVRTSNAINLSGWLPQVNLTGSLVHYNQLPTTLVSGSGGQYTATHTGVSNTFIPELSVSETIFEPQLLNAAQTAPLNNKQAEQITDSTKIYIVSAVSKSFYNLLLTLEQINVLQEDTARLEKTVEDTREQFTEGLVDETDYEQSVITLNNSKAQLMQQVQNVAPGYASLKKLMGYSPEKQFNVVFDTTQMEQEITFDTTKQLEYEKRIEYQQLQTVKKIQHQETVYNRLSFLPSVSAFYNYYFEYENNIYSDLFKNHYPYSTVGLSFNLPLFTGFSRIENIHESALREEVLDLSEAGLKSEIYEEYTSALANYKSNLYNWHLLKDNQSRAKNVFNIVLQQYEQGIVSYLNLIVAESNLITAEIGYTDALFQLLSSKIDLEKAMGEITFNY
ncbi:MAG: TolC family protein [Ignavibacteriaceae bacterium]|nr:TolC family protein [Ignavibacteriaceae bacterium]